MLFRDLRWQHWGALVAIVLMGLWVRCAHLGQNSLWIDEFFSLECSSGWGRTDLHLAGTATVAPDLINLKNARPLIAIWSSIATDENHPPLYFLILRLWREAFGDSATALRSLSVASSVLAIVFLFAVVVTMHGPRAALWACLLMAVAAPQIQQAQDARAYMPMTAACLAAAFSLARIHQVGPSWPRTIGLCLAAFAALMLHYMAFATVSAMLMYAAISLRGAARSAALFSLGAALVLFCLIWGPQFAMQHDLMFQATAWMVDNQSHHLKTTLYNLCSQPARFILDLDRANPPIACISISAFALPLLLYRRNRAVLLWALWFTVPIALALLIDLSTHRISLSLIKYTLAAAPAFYVMLGLLAAQIRRCGWIPAAIIAGCGAICIPSDYYSADPNWREVSKFISSSSRPGDPVVFVDGRPYLYCGTRLLSVSYYLGGQSRPLFVLDRPSTGDVLATLQNAQHVCVIGDSRRSLTSANLAGLKVDHVELLDRMALAALANRPRAEFALAKTITDIAR